MKEMTGNMWAYADAHKEVTVVVVTTNGYVRKDGTAVMGRGCAKEAARRWPWLPLMLGRRLQARGNAPFAFRLPNKHYKLVTMPVKPVVCNPGDALPKMRHLRVDVPGWGCYADLGLIERSAHEMRNLLNGSSVVIFPRPGCGNGGLGWPTVRKVLEPIFKEDKYIFFSYSGRGQ